MKCECQLEFLYNIPEKHSHSKDFGTRLMRVNNCESPREVEHKQMLL